MSERSGITDYLAGLGYRMTGLNAASTYDWRYKPSNWNDELDQQLAALGAAEEVALPFSSRFREVAEGTKLQELQGPVIGLELLARGVLFKLAREQKKRYCPLKLQCRLHRLDTTP
jgi:hypothetical protein